MKKIKPKKLNTDPNVELKHKKLNIKVISFFSAIGVILFILFSTTAFVPRNWIVTGGSTSVDPIMQKLSPYYKKNYKSDFIYNSMGSAAAPVGITNGYYDIGFESKAIKNPPKNACEFTIAVDYFMIVFNLPSDIHGAGTDGSVQLPGLTKLGQVMKDLYSSTGETFLQFNEDVKTINSGKPALTFDNPRGSSANKHISLFTRESGSGTRDFMEKNIIGTPGSTNHASVESSNGGMVNAIESSPGSVGYSSFSYTQEFLNHHNINIASVEDQLPYKRTTPNEIDFNDSYSLKRPFAGMVRLNSPNLLTCLQFIDRILWDHTPNQNPIRKIIQDLGFKPIGYSDTFSDPSWNSNVKIKELINDHGLKPDRDKY